MAKREAPPGASETGDPLLLTPGPLTTSRRVKEVMVHDWGSRDAAFLAINARGAGAPARDRQRQGHARDRADAGLGHLRRRGDAHDASCRAWARCCCSSTAPTGSAPRRICLIAGRRIEVHETAEDTPPDLDAVERALKADPDHHARVRGALRDDQRHPEPDRRDRRAGRALRAPAADRCHERVRRAAARCHARRSSTRSPPPPTSASRACRDWASSSAARRRWRRPRATPPRWCSTCTTSGRTSPRPGNTASRRRSMSSCRSTGAGGVLGRGRAARPRRRATPRTAAC